MEPQQQPGVGRARGRAKGRARGQQQPQQVQTQQPGQVQVPSQPGPRAGYRGAERPGGLQGRPVEQAVAGVAAMSLGGNGGNGGNGNGNNGKKPMGRGQLRGRREIGQQYYSRPESATEKTGQGEKVSVLANYYEFKKNKQWALIQYHVDILPEEDRTYERKKLVRNHRDMLKGNFIFDGTCLFTTYRLGQKVTTVNGKKEDASGYKITFTEIKDLHHFDNQYIQILNIILRRCQEYIGLKLVGRNFYDPKLEKSVPKHKLVIWPGFATSIRHHEQAILMNVDVSHKIIRQETVLQIISDLRQKGRSEESVLGCIVMTKYNSRTYRVDQINNDLRPSSKFAYQNGMISYNDYFQNKYNIRIMDQNQPMLTSVPKERDIRRGDNNETVLVPELCTMTGISDEMKNNFHTMKDIGEFTKPDPMKRVNALQMFNSNLRSNEKVREELKSWDLELSSELVSVNGHMANAEMLYQGPPNDPRSKFAYRREESDWSRPSRGKALDEPVQLRKWALIFLNRTMQETRNFVQDFISVGPGMGMSISDPDKFELTTDNVPQYIQALKKCEGYQLVMVVLTSNRTDRYSALKKETCNVLGIPSQFILSRTISKPNLKSIATKVAIQVNCKLGGEAWHVEMPVKAMFVGFDVHHHSRQKGSSFGATVASYNRNGTKYFGTVNIHVSKDELSNNFYTSIKAAITNFMQMNNGIIPPNIFIFRDGVGDSQVEYVKEIEIKAIREFLTDQFGDKRPKLVFIVVSKRINTRIFGGGQGRVMNPMPGTVVDNVITLPERFDFFLVSQAVRQGTVSPTSYNVIENESALNADKLQRVCYKMCHLYYNWQGTVTVPAPCMYAHKLAFMAGTATHDKVHKDLRNKLWFL